MHVIDLLPICPFNDINLKHTLSVCVVAYASIFIFNVLIVFAHVTLMSFKIRHKTKPIHMEPGSDIAV